MKQSEVLAPTPIKYPVAYAGIKNNIPLLPTGTNHASITEGFPEMTMKPLKEGGLPPRGEDINGLFYLTTDQKAFFQDGGYITFDAAVSMLIGGYPKGAILDYYNELTNYYTKVTSLIDDNTNNFVEDPALIDGINWQFVDFGTGANENLSNISSLALDRINQSKALITGNVANYEEELSQITQMSHSTFDRSKFTVVGSPNITDDGIASGFSSGNYIVPNVTAFSNVKNFSWEGMVKLNSTDNPTIQTIIQTRMSDGNICFQVLYEGSEFALELKDSNATVIVTGGQYGTFVSNPNANEYYKLKFKVLNGDTLKLYTNNTLVSTYTFTNTTFSAFQKNTGIGIRQSGNDRPFNGSIDLKQFSITVDGVEVFSGNKTGIDTIKPDDYTVVGTPTISADGIISDITTSNYVKTVLSKSFATANTWEIDANINITSLSAVQRFYLVTSGVSNSLITQLGTDGKLYCYLSNTTTGDIANGEYLNYTASIGQKLKTRFLFTGTAYQFFINENKVWEKTSNIKVGGTTDLNVLTGGAFAPLLGSQDLNSFKVYIDGNLVYQPCLKIPYTESKTGSKIVQSVYRDRVNDMYEQFGYAPYYTLSDTDFTLPQGELYGLIEKRARDIAHPIGEPFYRLTDEIFEDEVRLEGAEVDKGLYLAIEQKLAGYCSAGSDSTKIVLPNFINRVPWGYTGYGYIEAGLPNITGTLGQQGDRAALRTTSGAFVGTGDTHFASADYGVTGAPGTISLDASRSSSIYKNDVTTVQPPAFKVRWLARYK